MFTLWIHSTMVLRKKQTRKELCSALNITLCIKRELNPQQVELHSGEMQVTINGNNPGYHYPINASISYHKMVHSGDYNSDSCCARRTGRVEKHTQYLTVSPATYKGLVLKVKLCKLSKEMSQKCIKKELDIRLPLSAYNHNATHHCWHYSNPGITTTLLMCFRKCCFCDCS